ncbi:MAG: site-specific DNA-methyltransferase [Minisyncoccia bacterium]|jgi:adenine-specific DNA-methyltransferase
MNEKELIQQRDNQILRLQKEVEKLKKSIKTQRYGIVWADVPEAFEDDVENKLPVLEEVPKLAIKSKDDKPTHILIEGDNYHALTCLNYTHKGKVDVIYIDPPYNTGSDGFRYRDKRILDKYPDGTDVPQDHPFRHSYWLSFMKKRLELAKDLLKDDGVIFISIDINEMAQLKLLADEVFENNLISLITVKVKDPAGVGQQSFIFDVAEYVLMYAKNTATFKAKHQDLPLDYEELNEQYGSYNKVVLDFGKPKLVKEITRQNVGAIKIYQCQDAEIGRTTNFTFKEYIKKRDTIFADYNPSGGMILAIRDQIPKKGLAYIEYVPTKGRNAGQMTKGYFLNGRILAWLSTVAKYENGVLRKQTKMSNVWNVANASLHLEGNVDFTNGKKPLELVEKLIGMFNIPNGLVLDFFAGSGTTGEAVMSLNATDAGKRQFILITNNDEITNGKTQKIMSDVCYPRIKNSIKGYRSRKGLGNSIKFYKTSFVGKHNILDADDKDRVQLAHHAGEMLSIAENTLDAVEKTDHWQVFESRERFTAVYFREEYDKLDAFIAMVKKLKKPVTVYVFSWEDDPYIADFEDHGNITVKTIPEPIVEIYKQIYNLV